MLVGRWQVRFFSMLPAAVALLLACGTSTRSGADRKGAAGKGGDAGMGGASGVGGPGEGGSATAGDGAGGATAGEGGHGGAGGATEPYELCDGSASLRFGYQIVGGGAVPIGVPLLVQNGFAYWFVDGRCRYWVFGTRDSTSYFQATRTGTLDDGEARALSAELELGEWVSGHAVQDVCDGPRIRFFTASAERILDSSCRANETGPVAELRALHATVRDRLDELWRAGTDLDGPVRLLAIEQPDDVANTRPRAPWVLETEITDHAISFLEAIYLDPGDPMPLVADDPGLPALRELRARLIAGEFSEYDGQEQQLVVETDRIYAVYFRDALAFEDENGIVR